MTFLKCYHQQTRQLTQIVLLISQNHLHRPTLAFIEAFLQAICWIPGAICKLSSIRLLCAFCSNYQGKSFGLKKAQYRISAFFEGYFLTTIICFINVLIKQNIWAGLCFVEKTIHSLFFYFHNEQQQSETKKNKKSLRRFDDFYLLK